MKSEDEVRRAAAVLREALYRDDITELSSKDRQVTASRLTALEWVLGDDSGGSDGATTVTLQLLTGLLAEKKAAKPTTAEKN